MTRLRFAKSFFVVIFEFGRCFSTSSFRYFAWECPISIKMYLGLFFAVSICWKSSVYLSKPSFPAYRALLGSCFNAFSLDEWSRFLFFVSKYGGLLIRISIFLLFRG